MLSLLNVYKKSLLLITVGLLTSCQAQKENKNEHDYSYLEAPYKGHYKVGEPYKVDNKWYYPKENEKFIEEGQASYYGDGDGFHGRKTANGDRYNQRALTAAHRTLPLPSMARVTNLENGHSVIVMINDRGPFAKERIIDVSSRAAELLGFKHEGVTNVRVEYLPKQTEELIYKLKLKNAQQAAAKEKEEIAKEKVATSAHKNNPSKNYQPLKHKYYIQVGAYKSKLTADKLASKLGEYGEVEVSQVTRKGMKLYRVRLGPQSNLSKAQNTLEKIVNSGYQKSIITEEN